MARRSGNKEKKGWWSLGGRGKSDSQQKGEKHGEGVETETGETTTKTSGFRSAENEEC